MHNIKMKQ